MDFQKLTNQEYLTHVTHEKNLYAKYDMVALGIQAVHTPFETSLAAYQTAMTRYGNKSLVSQKEEKEFLRDKFFKGIRDHAQADVNHWDEAKAAAALRLTTLIREHGWTLYSESNRVQTAKMIALIGDIEKYHLADITLLELEEWYGKLKTAETEYEEIYQVYLDAETESSEMESPTKMRPPLAKVHTALRETLPVLYRLTPTDDMKALIAKLDELDGQTERSYKARHASKKSKDDDEGKSDAQPVIEDEITTPLEDNKETDVANGETEVSKENNE